MYIFYMVYPYTSTLVLINLRPYLGNIFILMFTDFFLNIATMIFTAYARNNSKTSVQNKESLPQCKKNRVRIILAIYTLY